MSKIGGIGPKWDLFGVMSFMKIPLVSPSLDQKEKNCFGHPPPNSIAQLRLWPRLTLVILGKLVKMYIQYTFIVNSMHIQYKFNILQYINFLALLTQTNSRNPNLKRGLFLKQVFSPDSQLNFEVIHPIQFTGSSMVTALLKIQLLCYISSLNFIDNLCL